MSVFTPPPDAPQRGDRATFSNRVDAFLTWLIGFVSQLISFESNLNSIAAGGAYAIPFLLDTSSTADADPGNGKIRFNNAVQSSATTLFVDTSNSAGADVTNQLAQFGASTSPTKGTIRITKQGDVSKYLVFNVTSVASPTGYRQISVVTVDASSASPFVANDTLQLQFTRAGDLAAGIVTLPTLRVQHQGVPGNNGQNSVVGSSIRTLNLATKNTISGAALNSNQITLPAGTYRVAGSAPCYAVGGHQASLNSGTTTTVLLSGTGEYNNTQYPSQTRSIIAGELVLSASTVLTFQHYANSVATGGLGVSQAGQIPSGTTGAVVIWGELIFEKVA
jgi:hypothetical protein